MATSVKKCTCESDFQDQVYGKGNRLFNLKEGSTKGHCTVCGKEI